jgi:hypothetical protein
MSPLRAPAVYADPTGMLDLTASPGQQLRLLLPDSRGVYECAWYNVHTDLPPTRYLRLDVACADAPDGLNIPELPATPGSIWPTAQGRCQVRALHAHLDWTLQPYVHGTERLLQSGGTGEPAMVFRDGKLELLLYYPDAPPRP